MKAAADAAFRALHPVGAHAPMVMAVAARIKMDIPTVRLPFMPDVAAVIKATQAAMGAQVELANPPDLRQLLKAATDAVELAHEARRREAAASAQAVLAPLATAAKEQVVNDAERIIDLLRSGRATSQDLSGTIRLLIAQLSQTSHEMTRLRTEIANQEVAQAVPQKTPTHLIVVAYVSMLVGILAFVRDSKVDGWTPGQPSVPPTTQTTPTADPAEHHGGADSREEIESIVRERLE